MTARGKRARTVDWKDEQRADHALMEIQRLTLVMFTEWDQRDLHNARLRRLRKIVAIAEDALKNQPEVQP